MDKDKRVVFNKDTDVVETGRVRWEEHGDRPHLQSHQQAHQQAKESQNQPWVDRLKFTTSKPTTPETSGDRNSIGVQISPSIEMPDIKADTAKMESAMKERQAELKAKTEEEQEAKHRKAEKMWSAIGDGISAIANMATVGAGADSMYNPADSLHSKVKSKWDEIKANKAAVAAANRKAQMDLLLKDLELGARAKEAEANRNFNIWKTETEEEGKNRRAKEDQEFKASEKQKDRDNDKEVAKIRGKYSRSSGGGSSSTGKYFFNGKAYKSASERNQAILNAAKKYQYEVYDDDDNLRDWDVMAVELEDLIAQGESQPQPQPGNYAQRWGSMFGGNSTSVPSVKPSKASTTKSDPKKDTTSLYN